jgi:putative SOS response-associated peptidase YedK
MGCRDQSMCNDYGNRVPYTAYLEAFSHLKIRLFAPSGAPNLEPRDDIRPTDVAPIIHAAENGAELVQLRWGFPSGRPKGPPVINMRSEKRRFPHGRCLVPASHFTSFTGKSSLKDKWRFTKADEDGSILKVEKVESRRGKRVASSRVARRCHNTGTDSFARTGSAP